jgi:hypothetical protein
MTTKTLKEHFKELMRAPQTTANAKKAKPLTTKTTGLKNNHETARKNTKARVSKTGSSNHIIAAPKEVSSRTPSDDTKKPFNKRYAEKILEEKHGRKYSSPKKATMTKIENTSNIHDTVKAKRIKLVRQNKDEQIISKRIRDERIYLRDKDGTRISKVLSMSGAGSRRACDELVKK